MPQFFSPNGPVALDPGSYDYDDLNTRLNFALAGDDANRGARVATAIANAKRRGLATFRAGGTGTQLPNAYGGGSDQSSGGRLPMYFAEPITEMQFLMPTFVTNTANGTDEDIVQAFNFQIGVDEGNTQSMTVPARGVVRWNGAATGSYSPNNGQNAYVASDVYVLSAPRTSISIFHAIDWVGTPPNTKMPRNTFFPSAAGTFARRQTSATGSLITDGWVHNVTDIGAETTTAFAALQPLVLVKTAGGSVLLFGSSSTQGIGIATAGTGLYNNPAGDARRNSGWPSRYVDRNLAMHYANLGVSGETASNFNNIAKSQRRRTLIAKLNPSHCMFQMINDLVTGDVPSFVNTIVATQAILTGIIPNMPIVPVTSQPRSTSPSFLWQAADGSDQVAMSYWQRYADFDALVRAGGYPFITSRGKYVEATIPVMIPGSPYLHKTIPSIVKGYTSDGTHLTGDAIEGLVLPYLGNSNPFYW